MSIVGASLLGYTIKAVVFAVIAYAGILGGKMFRDYRQSKKAAENPGDRQ